MWHPLWAILIRRRNKMSQWCAFVRCDVEAERASEVLTKTIKEFKLDATLLVH